MNTPYIIVDSVSIQETFSDEFVAQFVLHPKITQNLQTYYAYKSLCYRVLVQIDGAAEKTRTSTGLSPTATSTLRVYQFRHGRMRYKNPLDTNEDLVFT
jgi:hypothetical protein